MVGRMIQALHVHVSHRGAALTASESLSYWLFVSFSLAQQASLAKEARGKGKADKKDRGELSWEMPGRVSI